jgi:hypothetical protein
MKTALLLGNIPRRLVIPQRPKPRMPQMTVDQFAQRVRRHRRGADWFGQREQIKR